jgi:hypothetical protein
VRADDEYLSWSECQALAAKAGILTPPVIARGKKAEIDALPDRFPSRLAVSLGLPPLGDGNLAEGLVVKPDVRMAAAIYSSSKRKIPRCARRGSTRASRGIPSGRWACPRWPIGRSG